MSTVTRIKDISGQTFGALKAIKPAYVKNKMWFWEFMCICGNTHIARGNTVVHQAKKGDKDTPSCGCNASIKVTKHGYRSATNTHPLYRAYRGMMDRCYNPKSSGYKWYGEVGVTVCPEWKDNPVAFIEWSLKNGWKKGLHIDKDIICTENEVFPHIYSPSTCQWVTVKTNVAFATNRDNYGKHPNIRLSSKEVEEIEYLYFSGTITNKSELARMYNLKSSSSITRLIKLAKDKVACSEAIN